MMMSGLLYFYDTDEMIMQCILMEI